MVSDTFSTARRAVARPRSSPPGSPAARAPRPPARLDLRPQAGGLLRGQLAAAKSPGPVPAIDLAGPVHPRSSPEAEHVLDRQHRERRRVRTARARTRRQGRAGERRRERVRVVRRRVDDRVLAVVREPVGIRAPEPSNAQSMTTMPGKPSASRSRVDVGRDHAEVLGDHRQLPELQLGGAEDRRAGTSAQRPSRRASGVRRDRPVGREAPEVVDPRHVDERSMRRRRSIHQR